MGCLLFSRFDYRVRRTVVVVVAVERPRAGKHQAFSGIREKGSKWHK